MITLTKKEIDEAIEFEKNLRQPNNSVWKKVEAFAEKCTDTTGFGYILVQTIKKSDLNGVETSFEITETVEHKQTEHDSFGGMYGCGGEYQATEENKQKIADRITSFFLEELSTPLFPATEKMRLGIGWFRDTPNDNFTYFLDKDATEFLKGQIPNIDKKIAELKTKTRNAKQQEILWTIEEKQLEKQKAEYKTIDAIRNKLRNMTCFEDYKI